MTPVRALGRVSSDLLTGTGLVIGTTHTETGPRVEVDFPHLGVDGTATSVLDAAGRRRYAWVVAEHVAHRVPDLVTWLADLAELTDDGAAVVLTIPDARFSRDASRPLTSVGQVLHAHLLGDVRPNVRAVFDDLRLAVRLDPSDAWRTAEPPMARRHTLADAREALARARDGDYVDAHVWVWRPRTFVEQVDELGRLGRSELVVEQVGTTAPGTAEFRVVLRRLPRGRSSDEDQVLRSQAITTVDDTVGVPRRPTTVIANEPRHVVVSPRERRLVELRRSSVRRLRRSARAS